MSIADLPSDGIRMAARLSGGVWGALVGDAMGVPYEFLAPSQITSVEWGHTGGWGVPPGTWSDDGSLLLALLDSLLATGFDPEDQGRRALAWHRRGHYTPDGDGAFDIGGATSQALDALERGTPALEAGPAGERASSNGSLMRILPVALWGRDLPDATLVARAADASRVTHNHPRCQAACAVHVLAARAMLHDAEPAPSLEAAFAAVRAAWSSDPARAPHLAALEELRTYPERTGSGYVLDSFWSAWDAVTASGSFGETIERAIRYGHDTDTTAAIAGGIAGIRWGWGGIPITWRRGMRGGPIVTPLVDGLIATIPADADGHGVRTSTASPLRLDLLDLSGIAGIEPGAGRAGITFLLGKKYTGHWTGDHWRDLPADAARLHDLGAEVLLLLVEDKELVTCQVTDIADELATAGVELIRFPIHDPHTPTDHAGYRRTIRDLLARVRAGATVAIACRGGIDRAGMTAACLLVEAGLPPREAIDRVHRARKGSLTMWDQVAYVEGWPHAE
ncbi:MAG: ADP-ribosylglycohydrolase family protein [Chloroflexota bacterium]